MLKHFLGNNMEQINQELLGFYDKFTELTSGTNGFIKTVNSALINLSAEASTYLHNVFYKALSDKDSAKLEVIKPLLKQYTALVGQSTADSLMQAWDLIKSHLLNSGTLNPPANVQLSPFNASVTSVTKSSSSDGLSIIQPTMRLAFHNGQLKQLHVDITTGNKEWRAIEMVAELP
jgi:hypothetical protein